MLFYPCEDFFMPSLAVQSPEHPMSFIGKHERLRRRPIPAKGREELQTLIYRHSEILFVRNHERRRLHTSSREMRRASRKVSSCGGACRRTAGFPIGEP